MLAVAVATSAALPAVADTTPLAEQTVTLPSGWAAVYVEVSPQGSLDDVFGSWPVDSVGLYDPATLLATRQYEAGWDSGGLPASPMALWSRDPDASTALSLPAGTVCVAFNTNDAPFAAVLRGVPAAPRMYWHVTGTNTIHNFFGFSIDGSGSVFADDYLAGFSGSNAASRKTYRIGGTDRHATPEGRTYGATEVSDGDVLLLPSTIADDWAGPLFVSPRGGLAFGTDNAYQTLTVRNEGAGERTVTVSLVQAANAASLEQSSRMPDALKFRDADEAATNAAWSAATGYGAFFSKTLAKGESLKLDVGIDRSVFAESVKGLTFGALLKVTEDGASRMKAVVPLYGETTGGSAAATAWPGGLWVGEVALDSVKGPGEAVATETGGTLKLRLPMHLDANGRLRLLQRVVAAGATEADGTYDYRLYAGGATIPATSRTVMRISAVCLPTETPVVEATDFDLASGKAVFEFTVDGGGATSLLRHPYHPQHDGLRWDFKTAAPSGDDVNNYKYDVKPETFSVKSRIALTLDFDGGEAAWNPQNAVSGTCEWRLEGLHHEGAVTVGGKMTLKRVSPKTELELE